MSVLYTTSHFHLAYPYLKNPSAIKSLRKFSEVLDVKQKTDVHRLGATKSKRKAIISGNMLWSIIPNMWGHTKINEFVKTALYDYIIRHPRVV